MVGLGAALAESAETRTCRLSLVPDAVLVRCTDSLEGGFGAPKETISELLRRALSRVVAAVTKHDLLVGFFLEVLQRAEVQSLPLEDETFVQVILLITAALSGASAR